MSRTLLIAEDNTDLLEVLSLHFDWCGYRVLKARDGAEVLAQLSQEPDLVLLDVMMPHPNGYEVCRALKSDPARRRLPVVLLTGRKTESDREWGLECGADAYLTKPFSIAALQQRVDALLARASEPAADPMSEKETAAPARQGEIICRWELDPAAARTYRQKYGELAWARLCRDLPAALLRRVQSWGIEGRRISEEYGVVALALPAPRESVEACLRQLTRCGDEFLRSFYDAADAECGEVVVPDAHGGSELRVPLLRLQRRGWTDDEALR